MFRKASTAAAVLALTAALGIGPAPAQQIQPVPPESQNKPEEQRAILLGKPIWTSDGKQAGIISDVLTREDGKLEAVHITLGEFLGLGDRMVRVDAGLLVTDGAKLQVTLSAEELGMLPEVARNA